MIFYIYILFYDKKAFFFLFKLTIIGSQLIYNVLLVSAAQQSESVIHISLLLDSLPIYVTT